MLGNRTPPRRLPIPDAEVYGIGNSIARDRNSDRGRSSIWRGPPHREDRRVRRCVRIWSITDGRVMKATTRMVPWHVGHASGVDFEELLQERRPPACGLGRRQSWFGNDRRCTCLGRLFLAAHAARVVGIPTVLPCGDVTLVRDVDQDPGEELQRVRRFGAGGGAVGLVGAIRHGLRASVVGQPLQRDGIPRAVAREPGGERAIVFRYPDGAVHVKPGVRPGQHAGGLLLVEEFQPHEQPEHGAAKRFGQTRRVMDRPRDERPVGPEATVGHQEMEVRMPVGA